MVAVGLLYVNFRQTKATEVAANTATTAAETAQRQLEQSERPWLTVSLTVDPPGIVFPKEGGVQMNIRPHIKNIGHSVASGVVFSYDMFLAYDNDGIFKQPLERQRKLCESVASKPVGLINGIKSVGETVIFPNDTEESWTYGKGISKAELDATPTMVPLAKGGKRLVPIIVGCLDYQYATSTHHHQTQFIYEVQRLDRSAVAKKLYPFYSIEVPRAVEDRDVVLTKYGFGGFYAY